MSGQIIEKNQYGEESINQLQGTPDQKFSDTQLPKTQVAALTALATPISAVTIALSTSNTYTDAAVNAAVNAALVTVVADMQAQLTKINLMITALQELS